MDSENIIKKDPLRYIMVYKNLALKFLCYNDIEVPDIEKKLSMTEWRYLIALLRLHEKHKYKSTITDSIKEFRRLIPKHNRHIYKENTIKELKERENLKKFIEINQLNNGNCFKINFNQDLFLKTSNFYFMIPYDLFEILTAEVKKFKSLKPKHETNHRRVTDGLIRLALHFLLRSSSPNKFTEEITESTSIKDYAKKIFLDLSNKNYINSYKDTIDFLLIFKNLKWIDFEAEVFNNENFSYKEKIYIKVKPKHEIFNIEDSSTKKKSN